MIISTTSLLQVTSQQISSEFMDGEVVILNLKDGVYYGLDSIGARIWELLQSGSVVARIKEQLLEEFDVDADQCEKDLLALLEDLREKGLIEVVTGATTA